MSEQPQNPTLVIGIGDFGRAVIERIVPDRHARFGSESESERDRSGAVQPLETIHVAIEQSEQATPVSLEQDSPASSRTSKILRVLSDPSSAIESILAVARHRVRHLLDLEYFVDNTAPTDARGPRLDIFVIGNLGVEQVSALVPGLVEQIGYRLRVEFRPILRSGEGALAVCPLMLVPRAADRNRIAHAIGAVGALSMHTDVDKRPHARLYVVEDQSGKYVLSKAELERSFAAFLHLLMFSSLRDDPGVRELVERNTEERTGPFATFACATLEVDIDALHRLCALQLARDALSHFNQGVLPLSEVAAEAHPLVPEPGKMESELWKEGAEGSLEQYLTPPQLPVPEPRWIDSPEEIAVHKFGPMWTMQTAKSIETFRDEVERFKMDRLAVQIESNGTGLASDTEDELLDRLRNEMGNSTRGPLRALEFARYASTHAHQLMNDAQASIASPNLHRFPPSPLDRGVAAIQEATDARPRRSPFRMRFFGGLSVLLGTFLIGSLVHAVFMHGGHELPWWGSGLTGLAFSLSTWGYLLWRHMKRHHNWVCAARDDLAQSLQRYLNKDIIDYFRRRLNYTRMLWVYRICRRVANRLDDLVLQLEGGRAALLDTERKISIKRRELLKHRGFAETEHGVLFRSVLNEETVDAFYQYIRPPDPSAVATRFLASVLEDNDPLEAPFADPEALTTFCMNELEHIREMSPYGDPSSPLFAAVTTGIETYLRQLALKLSPPLELVGASVGEAPSPARTMIIPLEAQVVVEKILERNNLAHGWNIHALSNDMARIHLLIEQGELPLDAVACSRSPRDGGTH